jgi:hypothetical protein
MVLAGGVLFAGCSDGGGLNGTGGGSGNGGASAGASGGGGSSGGGASGGGTSGGGTNGGGTSGSGGSGGSGIPIGGIPCGNASPDPCICGRDEGDPTLMAACAEAQTCVTIGGEWSWTFSTNGGYPETGDCRVDGGVVDVSQGDGGSSDAATDGAPKNDGGHD